jgi:hypothetical protein
MSFCCLKDIADGPLILLLPRHPAPKIRVVSIDLRPSQFTPARLFQVDEPFAKATSERDLP